MSYSLRIDELLLRDGLVTEDQIKDALEHQREHGGKLGSHLLKLGYINEPDLLSALANQINCQSVILSDLEIPSYVAQLIPANVAIARNVVPFAFDATENTVKVACEDPNDLSLINELSFVDVIGGATVTSKAILKSIENALTGGLKQVGETVQRP